jgi:hypothetical protein
MPTGREQPSHLCEELAASGWASLRWSVRTGIFLAARDWIGLAFHVFVLIMTFKSFQAARRLDYGPDVARGA